MEYEAVAAFFRLKAFSSTEFVVHKSRLSALLGLQNHLVISSALSSVDNSNVDSFADVAHRNHLVRTNLLNV